MFDLSATITIPVFDLLITIFVIIILVSTILLIYIYKRKYDKNYIYKTARIPRSVWGKVQENARKRNMSIPEHLGSSIYHYNHKVQFGKQYYNIYKKKKENYRI